MDDELKSTGLRYQKMVEQMSVSEEKIIRLEEQLNDYDHMDVRCKEYETRAERLEVQVREMEAKIIETQITDQELLKNFADNQEKMNDAEEQLYNTRKEMNVKITDLENSLDAKNALWAHELEVREEYLETLQRKFSHFMLSNDGEITFQLPDTKETSAEIMQMHVILSDILRYADTKQKESLSFKEKVIKLQDLIQESENNFSNLEYSAKCALRDESEEVRVLQTSLRQEKARTDDAIAQYEIERQKVESIRRQLEQERERCLELREIRIDADQSKEKLIGYEKKMEEMTHYLTDLENKEKEWEEEAIRERNKASTMLQELRESQTEIRNLQCEIEEKSILCEDLKKTEKSMKNQIEVLEGAMKQAKKAYLHASSTIAKQQKFEKDVADMEALLESERTKLDDFQNALQEERRTNRELDSNATLAEKQLHELEGRFQIQILKNDEKDKKIINLENMLRRLLNGPIGKIDKDKQKLSILKTSYQLETQVEEKLALDAELLHRLDILVEQERKIREDESCALEKLHKRLQEEESNRIQITLERDEIKSNLQTKKELWEISEKQIKDDQLHLLKKFDEQIEKNKEIEDLLGKGSRQYHREIEELRNLVDTRTIEITRLTEELHFLRTSLSKETKMEKEHRDLIELEKRRFEQVTERYQKQIRDFEEKESEEWASVAKSLKKLLSERCEATTLAERRELELEEVQRLLVKANEKNEQLLHEIEVSKCEITDAIVVARDSRNRCTIIESENTTLRRMNEELEGSLNQLEDKFKKGTTNTSELSSWEIEYRDKIYHICREVKTNLCNLLGAERALQNRTIQLEQGKKIEEELGNEKSQRIFLEQQLLQMGNKNKRLINLEKELQLLMIRSGRKFDIKDSLQLEQVLREPTGTEQIIQQWKLMEERVRIIDTILNKERELNILKETELGNKLSVLQASEETILRELMNMLEQK